VTNSTPHNPVGWFEIYVQDMKRAKAFYKEVFGSEFTDLTNPGQPPGMEMWAFPTYQNAMGITGALVKMPGLDAGKNSVIVYFICADCAVEAAKVEKAGGRIDRLKFSIGQYGHIALVRDTEGNTIGLHSMQ
jgi:predicted enzyme related to lactoylglutathione lyase